MYVCIFVAMDEQQFQSRLDSILNVIEDKDSTSQETTMGGCDGDTVCLQSPAAAALSAFNPPLCNLLFPHTLASAQLS